MKHSIGVVLVCGLASCAGPTHQGSAGTVMVVPLEITKDAAVIHAASTGRSLRLLLDFGEPGTIVLRDDAAAAERVLVLPDLSLGNLTLRNVRGYARTSRGQASPPVDVDGSLGWGFIERFKVLIDYDEEQLLLSQGDQFPGYDIDNWTHKPISIQSLDHDFLAGHVVFIDAVRKIMAVR